MMDESKTPPNNLGSCRYQTLCRGVLDLSIIQGPFSITKCQTLVSRFATFSSQYGGAAAAAVRGLHARRRAGHQDRAAQGAGRHPLCLSRCVSHCVPLTAVLTASPTVSLNSQCVSHCVSLTVSHCDESKTPPTHSGSCRYLDLYRGVLDLSIIQ
jgi:hypothetical protein